MTSIQRHLSEEDFEGCFHDEPTDTDPHTDLTRGRTRLRRTHALAAAGAAAVVVALSFIAGAGLWSPGVDAVPATGPSPTSVPDERTFLLPPDSNQRIYYSTIESDPLPTPAPRTLISAADAVAAVAKTEVPAGVPITALRMISAPGGLSGIPTSPEPFWVLNWTNTPPDIRTGPIQADPTARVEAVKKRHEAEANSVCGDVTFVNATTGRPVNGLWHLCTHR